jgi:hypothetical protein
MGIETVLFVLALIIVGVVWSLSRKARRAGGPDQSSTSSGRRRP